MASIKIHYILVVVLLGLCRIGYSAEVDDRGDFAIINNENENKILVFFVHGILGDKLTTWGEMSNLLAGEQSTSKMDFVFWGYPSTVFEKTSISQIGDLLATEIRNQISERGYEQIVLVGHSMGGIISRSYVISALQEFRATELKPIKSIITFATPHFGSSTASMIKMLDVIGANQQVDDMAAYSNLLFEINRLWNLNLNAQGDNAAWKGEVVAIAGTEDEVVDYASAIALFPKTESLPFGHRAIAKPDTRSHATYRTLMRLLSSFKGPNYKESKMISIPSGSFMQGSAETEVGRNPGEGPVREVKVAAFEIAAHELTWDEWESCELDGGCSLVKRPTFYEKLPKQERGSHPVVNVPWLEAKRYIRWINKRSGKNYRLPTESEWEYAARSGTTGAFSFSEPISSEKANYWAEKSYNSSPKDEYRERTVPVMSLPANDFGLYEMHGNVYEWAEDCWHPNYENAPLDGTARLTGAQLDCSKRVQRGGAWKFEPKALRSASRGYGTVEASPYEWHGFRLAR
ncbi:SUMF1/EgtB/PvdO family nonheme iron enzyme [bacterium]|nr:SUMF1/EgtB/PvdO family nonheme iron enzyme [bacterium]